MAAIPLLPLDVWTSQITQASVPANQNALRVEVFEGLVVGIVNDVDSTLAEGDIYIVGATPTGDFASFTTNNLVIYKSGNFYEFEPNVGLKKDITVAGETYIFDGAGWTEYAAGGGGGGGSLQIEALNGYIKAFANSPDSTLADGDIFIVDTAPVAEFSSFTPGNLVIYKDGEFTEFEPPLLYQNDVGLSNNLWKYFGAGFWIHEQEFLDNTRKKNISATFDGGGVELVAGSYTFIQLPCAVSIDRVFLLADLSGNAEIEVEHCTYADFPTFSSVTGTLKPSLVIQQKNNQVITSSWTNYYFGSTDILKITLLSVTDITKLTVNLMGNTYNVDP